MNYRRGLQKGCSEKLSHSLIEVREHSIINGNAHLHVFIHIIIEGLLIAYVHC